jgi:hypothetical protein
MCLCMLCQNAAAGEEFRQLNSGFAQANSPRPFSVFYLPTASLGTHRMVSGVALGIQYQRLLTARKQMGIEMAGGLKAMASYRNLGIPGQSTSCISWLRVGVGVGSPNRFPGRYYLQQGPSRWNASYYAVSYDATDGTSQMSAGLVLERSDATNRTVFTFENDMFWFKRLDQYRTAAATLWHERPRGQHIPGAGIGAMLWTGTTRGLPKRFARDQYDMSHQHGGDYAHGIFFFALRRDAFVLRIGYDSEPLRHAFQDPIHRVVNDGAIPAPKRDGRVFIELSLFEFGPLYY